jgi:hypothetical protein
MTRSLFLLAFTIGCAEPATGPMPGDTDDDSVARTGDNAPCTGTSDYDVDGVVDVNWTYSYDGLGRSAMDVGRYTFDGSETVATYGWDNVDHLVSFHEVYDFGGSSTYTANYNTLGDMLDRTWTSVTPDDQGTTTEIDRVVNLDFDAAGHPLTALQTITGAPDRELTYTYDALGRAVTLDVDIGLDGTIDAHSDVVYDDVARIGTRTTTRLDGSHSVRTRTYDASSRVLSYFIESVDADGMASSFGADFTWAGANLTTVTYQNNGLTSSIDRYTFCD